MSGGGLGSGTVEPPSTHGLTAWRWLWWMVVLFASHPPVYPSVQHILDRQAGPVNDSEPFIFLLQLREL